jgi:hypothetical protein
MADNEVNGNGTPGSSKPKQPQAPPDKPTSKLIAYRAWLKSKKTAKAEDLFKATGKAVKKETCGAWLSFWRAGTNLPKEVKETEAKSKATPNPKKKDKN